MASEQTKAEMQRKELRKEQEVQRKVKDLIMIREMAQWARWPFLPLTKYNVAETRLLWVGTKGLVVHCVNIFRLPETIEEFKALPKKEYETHEAILEDGWMVD